MRNISSKTLLLLFVALISLARSHYDDHTCVHEKHQAKNPPGTLNVEEDFSSLTGDRMLATYPQFRIYADYDALDASAPASYASYVKDDLMSSVISYFQSALKIKYPVADRLKIESEPSGLCSVAIPKIFNTTGVPADFAIIFDSWYDNSTIVASSFYCYVSAGMKRPVIGTTSFNRRMFKEAKGDAIIHEKNIYLMFHEIMHMLGFSITLYESFVDSNGKPLTGHVKVMNVAGRNHTVLTIPSLTERLRKFHGCATLPGAIMEDDGGLGTEGSHFEKKYYMFETMASNVMTGKRTSEFSLAVLEASGWYEVDYSFAEPYFFGQGQGCNFINQQCSTKTASFDEFCVGSNRECAFQGHSGGTCRNDTKTEGCRYVIPDNKFHCEDQDSEDNARFPSLESYGSSTGSKCFNGDLSSRRSGVSATSFCFKYNCVGTGSRTQLEVLLGKKKVICTREGKKTVDGYYGSLNCPDPVTFCNTIGKKYCPRNCMGQGTCVNNKCVCNKGFKGVDCAFKA